MSCSIEGKGVGKDIHYIVHKIPRFLFIYYKISFGSVLFLWDSTISIRTFML